MKYLIYCFICIAGLCSLNAFGLASWKKDCHQILENSFKNKFGQKTQEWISSDMYYDNYTSWSSYLDCIKRNKKIIESEITNIEEHFQNLHKENPEEQQAEIHEVVMPLQNEEAEPRTQPKGYLCNPMGRSRLYYDSRCNLKKAYHAVKLLQSISLT